MTIRRIRGIRAIAKLIPGVALLGAAALVFGWERGIESQRVHVRFVDGASDAARVSAEKRTLYLNLRDTMVVVATKR